MFRRSRCQVARMRELIVEAAASGDIERLPPPVGKGPTQTQVTATPAKTTRLPHSKSFRRPGRHRNLAILLDVHVDGLRLRTRVLPRRPMSGPYFAEKPLSSLTAPEKVDLFRLLTAGDFRRDGRVRHLTISYRVGITPDGKWKFFVAGD